MVLFESAHAVKISNLIFHGAHTLMNVCANTQAVVFAFAFAF
jgi:hypothetical protein